MPQQIRPKPDPTRLPTCPEVDSCPSSANFQRWNERRRILHRLSNPHHGRPRASRVPSTLNLLAELAKLPLRPLFLELLCATWKIIAIRRRILPPPSNSGSTTPPPYNRRPFQVCSTIAIAPPMTSPTHSRPLHFLSGVKSPVSGHTKREEHSSPPTSASHPHLTSHPHGRWPQLARPGHKPAAHCQSTLPPLAADWSVA